MSQLPYYETRTFQATLGGRSVHFVSKPGMAHWQEPSPAQRLLAEAATFGRDDRVLVVDAGTGALAAALRMKTGAHCTLIDANAIALDLAPRTFAANDLDAPVVHGSLLDETERGRFDAAVFVVPQHRKLARRRLVEIHAALRDGGALFLAGPNNEGIQSAIEDVRALFGNAAVLFFRERNRVARANKTGSPMPPIWATEPGIALDSWHEWTAAIPPYNNWHILSLPGVFSYDRIDVGTAFLLKHLEPPRDMRVLDVGCGYGLIGLWALKHGAARVDLIDVNLLAVASARRTLMWHGYASALVLGGDALQPVRGERYDLVLTNPPFHAGKTIDYDAAHAFMTDARAALAPGGRLVVVANSFIPYSKLLGTIFGSVSTLADDRRFQVLVAR